ncbi:sorbosone dehydrogenase family protein [Erythrobacter arachoides]|uniref:Sorbosone dehydrogenase family protein n=1 Tax=Aurantiacibacter arachoides TaxID=1850444 RepID=A0A844ZWJ9_9SPHN|nr:sorbosone dehydrogenase family protein [Aurantiacibacter arachoides]MXO92671.1 sorbosone dehydrogenase family protein [Aurantiacibacter arachoides]GGD55335.1 sorbosone dehydrogenase [Aurantiacibacter arachoides]
MTRLSLAALPLLALVAACSPSSEGLDQTGASPTLPDQADSLIPAIAIAPPAGWDGELPTVPEGYVVTPIAQDLKIPRQMLVLPNGDVLVAEGSGGKAPKLRPKDIIAGILKGRGKSPVEGGDRITLLRDSDGDGQTNLQTTFISDLDAPYGLAFVDGAIYVANQGDLMRFPYTDGATAITAPGEKVTDLPAVINHHWTKALTASPDGSRLYVGIGSNSNVGERGMDAEEDRAVIWEVDPADGSSRVFASGIRNPTALAFDPWGNRLWSVVNERDELGPELVPDYLTSVREGGFYGWPYSYYGQTVDPRVHPQRPDMVARAIAPDYALGSHVAALGLSFVSDGGMGGRFAEGAFVGEHGSWNRDDRSGYKVVFVPFSGGRPSGDPIDFLTGFLADGEARGRPVGVLFDAPRGRLLVADDVSNTVWSITPRNRPRAPADTTQTANRSNPI